MNEYHKINSVYKRDAEGGFTDEFAQPEFKYLANNSWQFQEKIDGTNVRVMWDGIAIRFGGKTDAAQMPVSLHDHLRFDLFADIEKFKSVFTDMPACLYGEGFGAKIQKGGGNYIKNGVSFVLFDIKIGNFWLEDSDVRGIGTKLGIQCAPVVGYGTLADAVFICKQGFQSAWGPFAAEGLVCRPTAVQLFDRMGRRIITKIKHRDFKRTDRAVGNVLMYTGP